VSANDRVYVFGGVSAAGTAQSTTYIYDPVADNWSTGASMSVAREHLTAVAHEEFVYVIGGRVGGSARNTNERYDTVQNTWQTMTPMPTARSAMGLAVFAGRIHVVGGEIPQLFSIHEVYDIPTDAWSESIPMPVPRHGLGAVTLDVEIFFPGGGTIQGLAPTTHVDAFVPASAEVPAVSEWGLAVFALLMVTCGSLLTQSNALRTEHQP
jgi:hypothetical protein